MTILEKDHFVIGSFTAHIILVSRGMSHYSDNN